MDMRKSKLASKLGAALSAIPSRQAHDLLRHVKRKGNLNRDDLISIMKLDPEN